MVFTARLIMIILVLYFGCNAKKSRDIDPNYVDDGYHNSKWFLLHYHKTGHDLVNHISDSFTDTPCSADVNRLKVGRSNLEPHLHKVQGADIVPLAGVDMIFNWSKTFAQHPTHINRVLHFVRNPFDMVVSGYLYHSQIPPPPIERWITRDGFSVCDYNHDAFMNRYAPKLGELRGGGANGTEVVRKMVMAAVSLCKDLIAKYNGSVYRDILIAAKTKERDPLEGIRLEALRSLLHSEGGDIMRMGVNCLYEDRRMSKRVLTSQFPIGDRKTFAATAEEMFSFLMPPREETLAPPPFWTCLSRSAAGQRVEQRAFIAEAPSDKSGLTHVTAGLISNATRQTYLQALREDSVIGPLLTLVNEALHVYN